MYNLRNSLKIVNISLVYSPYLKINLNHFRVSVCYKKFLNFVSLFKVMGFVQELVNIKILKILCYIIFFQLMKGGKDAVY